VKRSTPVQYLQSASHIPEFETEKPVENFGDPGLYRAVVYTVQGKYLKLHCVAIFDVLAQLCQTPSFKCY